MAAVRITKKLLNTVVGEVAGEDVVPLVQCLKGKENVSEFKLAEDIGQEINITRNMLYRLHSHNLVTFTRKKDKKKGWYIYYWTFNMPMVHNLWKSLKIKRVQRLKERLQRETSNHYFACDERCIRLDFEQATDFQFKCPECGQLLNQDDNSKTIKQLNDDIKELESELKKLK